MTEKSENTGSVESLQMRQQSQDQHKTGQDVKIKREKVDDEVDAKLRALNAKIKKEREEENDRARTDSDDDGTGSSTTDDKKAIVPVKSSNEILAELFSVFNAAPPDELLDDKNLLKKPQKKIKKEKKKKSRNKGVKSDGECSESELDLNLEGKHKHKHKRKKHKHKHKDSRDKNKDKDREKSKEQTLRPDEKLGKEKEKLEIRVRDRKRATTEHENVHLPMKISKHDRSAEQERVHNNFYNGFRERDRDREWERAKDEREQSKSSKVNSERHNPQYISDVSLSDEETFLREKANGRQRANNKFYDDSASLRAKEEPIDSKRYMPRHRRRSSSRKRSRSRSRSRSLGIDKKRLLEIARKNAISMFKRGSMPGVSNMTQEVKDKVLLKMRYGGRTVQDLTEFCKKISDGNMLSELSSDEDSDVDKSGNVKAFHHPFLLKEREPIVMHIRNSTPIVPAIRKEDHTKAITMQFPVSSGQVHRMSEAWVPVERKDPLTALPALPAAKQSTNMFKDAQKNVFAKTIPQLEQQEPAFKPINTISETTVVPAPVMEILEPNVPEPPVAAQPISPPIPFVPEVPVPSTTTSSKEAPLQSNSIFPQTVAPTVDVSCIITQRLNAIRRLQDNPTDSEALKMMYNAQRDMSSWATSKHLPGQFTGSTGAQVMKVHELNSGPQLWVRRDQLTSTKPVTGGMGMALLQKMGWKPGEGLGRTKTGSLQPLLLDVKLDKRGLVSREDIKPPPPRMVASMPRKVKPPAPPVTQLNAQDKHPVCVLNELTSKNKWTPPKYILQHDTGPAHCRVFLFSVEINGKTYMPPQASNNKKEAKLNAAKLCLRELGILPPS